MWASEQMNENLATKHDASKWSKNLNNKTSAAAAAAISAKQMLKKWTKSDKESEKWRADSVKHTVMIDCQMASQPAQPICIHICM